MIRLRPVLLASFLAACAGGERVNTDVETVSRMELVEARNASVESGAAPLKVLVESHPTSVVAHRALQDHLRAELEPRALRTEYAARAAAAPDDAIAHYLLGRVLIAEPEAAEASFVRARALDPLNPWPVVGQAYLRASRGDLFGTIELYEEALQAAPNSAMLHLFLGNHLLELRLHVKAQREIQEAHALAPDDVEVWAALGKVYAQLDRPDEARAWLEKTRDADPSIAHIYPTLASLYLGARDPSSAQAAYRAGLGFGLQRDEELAAQIRAAKLVAGVP